MGTTGTPITEVGTLSYLLPMLRQKLGDTDSTNYRYLDEWLTIALDGAILELMRWWQSKYLVDLDTHEVSRNSDYLYFTDDSPPIVQLQDITPIILMASIIVKSGELEGNSWNVGSWRDTEVSVSNIEGSRAKDSSLEKDYRQLEQLLKPPSKQLSLGYRATIPGEVD